VPLRAAVRSSSLILDPHVRPLRVSRQSSLFIALCNCLPVCCSCPVGYFGSSVGLKDDECDGKCDEGYICPTPGATSPTTYGCPVGTYSNFERTECKVCEAGKYSVEPFTSFCIPCEVSDSRVVSCRVLSCPVVSCRVLSCPVVSSRARLVVWHTYHGHVACAFFVASYAG
jgi:hypothetical protein